MPTYKVEYEEKATIKYTATVEVDSEDEIISALSDKEKILFKALTEWDSLEIIAEKVELIEEE